MYSIIPLPENFVGSTTAVMAGVVSDLAPYTTLIIGILAAVVIVEILIHAIRPKE
jgi:hypothetical protein